MKRKIQHNFKNYQKILLLILILLATLIFGFINSYYNIVEGLNIQLGPGVVRDYVQKARDDDATESKHKAAADKRSSGDGEQKKAEANNITIDTKLNSG